ncbi:MAG: YncE family protein, partial [Polyangiales bacterium]
MHRLARLCLIIPVVLVVAASSAGAQPPFVAFETGPVRPLAIDGAILAAVNTPDNRLETFNVLPNGITRRTSIPVGLEPCAVAIRPGRTEAWVVNHLSDSVSVVDLVAGQVIRTLLVGDEPRDIVMTDPDGAGPLGERVFITTAHRGQHRTHESISGVPGAGDPELTTPSVPRADVWVFDADNPGTGIGGTPLKIVELFGDTPRALSVSADGSSVYAAVFHSGNQTAVASDGIVCDYFSTSACLGDGIRSPNGLVAGLLPGGLPGPSTNFASDNAPESGLIVQFDEASGQWRDELARNWSNGIRFSLPDYDVFEIDATDLNEVDSFPHVGTINFNMAVNPVNGNVYVSNTEAQNLTRFEGPGIYAAQFGGSTVQGNLHQARITVLQGSSVSPVHLNSHIDYSVRPAPAGTKNHSLATPLD